MGDGSQKTTVGSPGMNQMNFIQAESIFDLNGGGVA